MEPEKLTVIIGESGKGNDEDEGESDSSVDDGTDLIVPKETLESDEELRMHLLGMDSFFSEAVETNWASKVASLPTRWLPPGTIRMLYYQMGRTEEISNFSCKHQAQFFQCFRDPSFSNCK
ncbi:unnamed protein product [Cladocopium goreaui]|uniref:Uncharacterized protein n=1 Tax=Cladocopium goreaui TaxID=2562237 RepID=A0A9P1DPW0_9DINO|nr:unnamed protein product [Cladocopium goreaui]